MKIYFSIIPKKNLLCLIAKRLMALGIFLFLFNHAQVVQADLVYTSYPHNWDGGGWIVPGNYFAVRFDVSSNYYLNEINLPIYYGGSDPNPLYFEIQLWSNQYLNGTLPRPNDLIGSWQSQAIYGMTGSAPQVISTKIISNPLLFENSSYWLLFKAAWSKTGDNDNRALLWYESEPYEYLEDISNIMFYWSLPSTVTPGNSWDGDFMAFEVKGTAVPVPEPSALLMGGLSILIAGSYIRRRFKD